MTIKSVPDQHNSTTHAKALPDFLFARMRDVSSHAIHAGGSDHAAGDGSVLKSGQLHSRIPSLAVQIRAWEAVNPRTTSACLRLFKLLYRTMSKDRVSSAASKGMQL